MRGRLRRLLVAAATAALVGVVGVALLPVPDAAAVGSADAVGAWLIALRGDGFDRNATSGSYSQETVRGRAVLNVGRATGDGDPRRLRVEVVLERALAGSLIDRATPSVALAGEGVLVGDSLTVIGAGQANFVNALTLRFSRGGKRVDGWWLASFPGSSVDSGFVGGFGTTFKGKRVKASAAANAAAATRR